MTNHLNIFRCFNESNNSEFIENNLSRAFTICLKNDPLLFSKYLQAIVSHDDYQYLFNYYQKGTIYDIRLQVNTNSFEFSGVRKVYAVAMTADENLLMDSFMERSASGSKELNLTDMMIMVKDIVIVVEVKRYNEDCRQQLYDQIAPFLKANEGITVHGVNYSWKHAIVLMEQVSNISKLHGAGSGTVGDFLELAGMGYPHWFSSRPFAQLPALSDQSQKTVHARHMRLSQIINHSTCNVLGYSDRMAIGIDFRWASEIIPSFKNIKNIDYVIFTIWPGNTKGQGYNIYGKPLDWSKKETLLIGNSYFDIDTEYHLKFCHFNRFVTALDFDDKQLLKPINTKENFHHKSGKWDLAHWPEFEAFMDEHFIPEFDWRKVCGFDEHFKRTDRSYFTVSLGFMTDLYIPYKLLQKLDVDLNNYKDASGFVDDIVNGYRNLLD